MPLHRASPLCLVLVALLSACTAATGNSSGSKTLALASRAGIDGWVQSNGTVHTNGSGPLVGDLDAVTPGVGYRQFFSFDLGAIPAGATVTSATLRLYQAKVLGAPFGNHGIVTVDHVTYGDTLKATAYSTPGLADSLGVLSSDTTTGFRLLDVTDEVLADLAAAAIHSQFRLRFTVVASDNDGINDAVAFSDPELSCCPGAPPQLNLTYTP